MTTTPHLVALAGTNHIGSTNQKLIDYIARHFSASAKIDVVKIADLPLFSKAAINQALPANVAAFVAKLKQADGVVIATPEYDHAVPAVLMNALEWCSIKPQPLVDKPVMIVGASYGALGASRAQANLRAILDAPELHARILPSSELMVERSLAAFDEDGNLKSASKVAQLEQLFHEFIQFIDLLTNFHNR